MEEIRKTDLAYLNRYYESESSHILVVYGNRNVEQMSLLRSLMENRRHSFYTARKVSEAEQLKIWKNELMASEGVSVKTLTFRNIFEAAIGKGSNVPFVFVIRNFEYIVKSSDEFVKQLTEFVEDTGKFRTILVILSSSDVSWVENNMVAAFGLYSSSLAGFRKIKPLPFSEMRRHFSKMPYKDAVLTYSVLGGQTLLWKYFDESLSFKENVCKNLLDSSSYLYGEAQGLTEYNLRETAVYHTILSEMAQGINKLNDLYHATGFSRAKISVYLKTLIHHDFAYKAYSFGNTGRENVVKGVYKIADPMLAFSFRFIFPNESHLLQMPADKFYDIFISAGIQEYASECFKSICREYIYKLEEKGLLGFEIEEEGEWIGKVGNIDLIVQSDTGDTAICLCSWQKMVTHEDLIQLEYSAKKARVEGDVFYLFSTGGFDEWLIDASLKADSPLRLIGIDELTNG